jgi:hypothetical protein
LRVLHREVFGSESELGQNVFHRNALAAALSKPGLATVKAPAVLVGDWFIVGWRRSHGSGDRIEQA